MANRPFEIGDWIYFKEHTGKQVVTAYIPDRRKVYTEDSDYAFNEDDISYIRTPRKGSKEARDIVAMLASLHRKHLKQMMKGLTIGVLEKYHKDAIQYFWVRRKRKDEFILRSSGYIEYQKAKSMLKKTPKQEVINE